MASVFNRGTRDNPNFYGQYKDATGKWRMVATGKRVKKDAQKWIDERQAEAAAGKPDPRTMKTCGELIPLWLDSIMNRNAKNDRNSVEKHVLPAFRDQRPAEVKHSHIVIWLDKLKKTSAGRRTRDKEGNLVPPGTLSGSTCRNQFNYLSRFFGWCIARGHCEINPARQLPKGERPRQAPKKQDAPWVKEDKQALSIAAALPSPFGLMYLVGNRCGLRPGEVAGLRISDLAQLADGCLRVRYHEEGPLKEDKGDGPEAKVKWAPAPPDVQALLASWLARREAQQADEEDFLFKSPRGRFYNKMQRSRVWRDLPIELRGEMTWYEGTRHSFASRNLSGGVPLEEVSAALGHSTPAVTLRHYSRFVRKTYSIASRPLQLEEAKVIPFPAPSKVAK